MTTKISGECLLANLEKAFQNNPVAFADSFVQQLDNEQPEIADSVIAIMHGLISVAEPDEDRRPAMAVVSMCLAGILYKTIVAQQSADEMKEVWG